MTRYCWSDDGENYRGDESSRECAILDWYECSDDDERIDQISTAEIAQPDVDALALQALDRFSIAKNLGGQAYEICGDHAGDWPSRGSTEMKATIVAMAELLAEHLRKNDPPEWFGARDVIEHGNDDVREILKAHGIEQSK